MPVKNLHLQQFRSASLITHFSHLRMDLKKLKEFFVLKHVRKKNLFQFKMEFAAAQESFYKLSSKNSFSLLKQAATGVT